MSDNVFRKLAIVGFLVVSIGGCSSYKGVVRPVPKLTALSPELVNLTDRTIDLYLRSNVKPTFPTVLAVAKLKSSYSYWGDCGDYSHLELDTLKGDEADNWRQLAGHRDKSDRVLIDQVQFINPMLTGGDLTLKTLRDAAAILHAPMLLVYLQADRGEEGYNPAAMAYWTIAGLFVIPGNSVGYHSVCQALLVDTRTGMILASIQGEGKREENVLAGAVSIAKDRTQKQARTEAERKLQEEFESTLNTLATPNASSAMNRDISG
jgi:hypothetical protein